MKKTFNIIILFVLAISIEGVNAQTAKENYFTAQKAFESKNYTKAVQYLDKVVQQLGSTNIKVQPMLIKALYHQKQYFRTAIEIGKYGALNPDNTLVEYSEILKIQQDCQIILDQERKDYQELQTTNNPDKFDSYVVKYSDSPKINEVKDLKLKVIETNFWNNITSKETVNAYREYLNKYPNGRYVNEAKTWIATKDQLYFETAKSYNTISKYDSYLSVFPNGTYASQVKHLRYKKIKKDKHFEHRKNNPFYVMYNYGAFTNYKDIRYPYGFTIGYSLNDELIPPSVVGGYLGYKAGSAVFGLTLGAGNLGPVMLNAGVTVAAYYDIGAGTVLEKTNETSSIGIDGGLSVKLNNRFIANASYVYYLDKGPNAVALGIGIILF